MRVIPVLDLKAGLAVHAIAGDRRHYRPVRSILHDGSNPVDLARVFRDRLGLGELYLADLDAIAGAAPAIGLVSELNELGLTLLVDAGVRDGTGIGSLIDAGAHTVILGLETLAGPRTLDEIVAQHDPRRLAFSLDLRAGMPMVAQAADWRTHDPAQIVAWALERGIARVIVLDLARVGTGAGVGTLELIQRLHQSHPDAEIVAGGGISGPADLQSLAQAGASGALVASALHDGRLRPEDWRAGWLAPNP